MCRSRPRESIRAGPLVATRGDVTRPVRPFPRSKPVTALALLVAAEEMLSDLEARAGGPAQDQRCAICWRTRPGLPASTGRRRSTLPGRRRVYSNELYRCCGEHLAAKAEMPFADYVHEQRSAIRSGSGWVPEGHPGAGMRGNLEDVLLFPVSSSTRRSWRPTHEEMIEVQFPGSTASPDFGRFARSTGGWCGAQGREGAPLVGGADIGRTFGHFGGGGTFVWVDPVPARLRRVDHARVRGVGEGGMAPPFRRRARRHQRITTLSYSASPLVW